MYFKNSGSTEWQTDVWYAQHDEHTLAPAKARAYELPSLSGQESDEIVILLMSLPNPSQEVITCIENAIEWFKASKIEGLKKEFFTNDEGKKDYRMVACTDCPPLWARFYTLENNQPFFSDRDGVKKFNISEIGYERRNGYSWYNSDGLKVFRSTKQWKKKIRYNRAPALPFPMGKGFSFLLKPIYILTRRDLLYTGKITIETGTGSKSTHKHKLLHCQLFP